ncbi:MAG: hypothetical protein K0S22_1613 [Oscillospiraceae bacterium]|jgi:hypothetical protein|nr:hypothetical protein [Oscillospiraceae bacterium]
MKQTIAFIMAIAVLTCTLSMTTFAATINFPVAGVSSNVYVEDEDGHLYLKNPASKVKYGETAYFPLLSKGSNAVIAASEALKKAQAELDQAQTNYDNAKKTYDAYSAAQTLYNQKKNAEALVQKAISDYDAEFAKREKAVNDAKSELEKAKLVKQQKQSDYDKAVSDFNKAKAEWEAVGGVVDSSTQYAAYTLALGKKGDAEKALNDANSAVTSQDNAVKTATDNLNALGTKTQLELKLSTAKADSEAALSAFKNTTHTADEASAKQAVITAGQTKDSKEGELATKTQKKKEAQTAYDAAVKAGNEYLYVYESDAIDKVRVTDKWEENGGYASNVELVRKRVYDNIIPGATSSSMNSIYFLKIKIKSGSTTQSRDLLGTVQLKKSGSDGFTINANIGIELGYSSASGSGGEIGKTGRTFKDGDGFDAEDDFEFSFEADGKSKFIVDTSGQGKIVLSFNRDYDSKIERKYPDAILEFFNGNYASFNRVGTLYLGSKIDDAYVYEISKTGELSRVSAKYDDYEEAYKISTRTLGRYVISDKKLAISSSSSSSSGGSGSGTGTGTGTGTGGTGTTVVPVAPSTPSYTYTPPTTPAASSSTAPPAQSSSSEEPEEEEESEPEELEDEDDIVDVVIDDEDAEGPEEKSGIPVWVWVLIIVGLAAIPIGIGVVYYLHSRPLRRDFFNAEEDEYDDDDDED